MPAVFSDRFSPNGDYELTKVALARQDIPADANALLSTWIEGERLLGGGLETGAHTTELLLYSVPFLL
jgi:hypothetical protein